MNQSAVKITNSITRETYLVVFRVECRGWLTRSVFDRVISRGGTVSIGGILGALVPNYASNQLHPRHLDWLARLDHIKGEFPSLDLAQDSVNLEFSCGALPVFKHQCLVTPFESRKLFRA